MVKFKLKIRKNSLEVMQRYIIYIFFTITLLSCVNTNPKQTISSDEDDPEPILSQEEKDLEAGRILFSTTCKLCHGADGKLGLNGAMDLSKSLLTKEEKLFVISNGRNTMAAYKNVFTKDEIKLLANYVESLKQ